MPSGRRSEIIARVERYIVQCRRVRRVAFGGVIRQSATGQTSTGDAVAVEEFLFYFIYLFFHFHSVLVHRCMLIITCTRVVPRVHHNIGARRRTLVSLCVCTVCVRFCLVWKPSIAQWCRSLRGSSAAALARRCATPAQKQQYYDDDNKSVYES